MAVEEWFFGHRNESTASGPVLSFAFVFERTWRTVSDLLAPHEIKEVEVLASGFYEELSEITKRTYCQMTGTGDVEIFAPSDAADESAAA